MNKPTTKRSPWKWVPTLYFAEGLPYVIVMMVSGIMYKRMELSNTDIALYTGWLNLPWVIKPLWSPFVDILKTKRWWIVSVQLLIGVALAAIAFSIPTTYSFQLSFAFFFLIAFSSATHDIACDGFYMLGLPAHQQAEFIGIRNTFYRIAMIVGQGIMVMFAGYLENKTGKITLSWSITFYAFTVILVVLFLYHRLFLPKPTDDILAQETSGSYIFKELGEAFISFFKKKQIIVALIFMLTYRFAEAQLSAIGKLFMLDPISKGGLGLNTEQIGFLYGTVAIVFLLLGGILGGLAIARNGLKYWLWPMALAITFPNITYLFLAYFQPSNTLLISSFVAIEQFGYGFGFTSFMMFLMFFSQGKYKTSHYAICTGFMALGMMLPSMIAGWLQEQLGYSHFFIWVMFASLLPILAVSLLKIDPEYGKKDTKE